MSDEEKLDLIGCGVNIGSRWSKQNTIEELEKIRAEIKELKNDSDYYEWYGIRRAINLIDNHISELKGE